MTKKESRTDKLPLYDSAWRTALLNEITKLPDYQKKLKEGYPLRTEEELEEIKNRYSAPRSEGEKTGGITFEEINEEQGKKSPTIKLKKPTFRKYIQDGLLPGSIGYTTVGTKRMALFPPDIISHINLLYYFYQVADVAIIDFFIELIMNIGTITYLEAIESFSWYDTFIAGVNHYLFQYDADISEAIKKALANKPEERDKILERLDIINKKFEDIIEKEIFELEKELKEKTIKVSEIPEQRQT